MRDLESTGAMLKGLMAAKGRSRLQKAASNYATTQQQTARKTKL